MKSFDSRLVFKLCGLRSICRKCVQWNMRGRCQLGFINFWINNLKIGANYIPFIIPKKCCVIWIANIQYFLSPDTYCDNPIVIDVAYNSNSWFLVGSRRFFTTWPYHFSYHLIGSPWDYVLYWPQNVRFLAYFPCLDNMLSWTLKNINVTFHTKYFRLYNNSWCFLNIKCIFLLFCKLALT